MQRARSTRSAFPPGRNSAPEQIESDELHSAALSLYWKFLPFLQPHCRIHLSITIPQPAQSRGNSLLFRRPSTIKLPRRRRCELISFLLTCSSAQNILLLFLQPAGRTAHVGLTGRPTFCSTKLLLWFLCLCAE